MNSAASVQRGERLRLFCALRLPEDILEMLVRWQAEHVTDGRAVPPENLHLTLAFLGSTPADAVPRIVESLRVAAAGAEPIVLEVSAYREMRSVGMLVFDDEGGNAASLARDLHGRLERLGVYRPERRRWLAHLSVVRFRTRPHLQPPLPGLGRFSPSDAALYNSLLRSTGAQYVVLESLALGGS